MRKCMEHIRKVAFSVAAIASIFVSGCAADTGDVEEDTEATEEALSARDLSWIAKHSLAKTRSITPDRDPRINTPGETSATFQVPNFYLTLDSRTGFRVYDIATPPKTGNMGARLFAKLTPACRPVLCVTYADGSATCKPAVKNTQDPNLAIWWTSIGDVLNGQKRIKKDATSIIVTTESNLKRGRALSQGVCTAHATLQADWYVTDEID